VLVLSLSLLLLLLLSLSATVYGSLARARACSLSLVSLPVLAIHPRMFVRKDKVAKGAPHLSPRAAAKLRGEELKGHGSQHRMFAGMIGTNAWLPASLILLRRRRPCKRKLALSSHGVIIGCLRFPSQVAGSHKQRM